MYKNGKEFLDDANSIIIKKDILSNETEKFFGDYWKQGKWGDCELNALQFLKESIK